MPMEDLWDNAVFTEVIRRNIVEESQNVGGDEQRQLIGATIAPLTDVQSRRARIRVSDVLPWGIGQFKAPDATPPLYKTRPKLTEFIVDLALLEEMERFTESDWLKLNSNDDAIARGALLSLTQRMTILQNRYDMLTEWMRWQAFKGTLLITYPDGGQILIDYGFTASHLPTAAVPWTDQVNSDPVADLYAWSQIGADDAGQYYSRVHLNSVTWRTIRYNQKIRSYLGSLGRDIMLPTRTDLQELMRENTGNFVISDAGYLPEGSTTRRLTKFLPDNRVLVTTDYTMYGTRIADVADGQVLVGGDTNQAPVVRQGMQSELIGNPYSKNVFRRQASARLPRIYLPECFLYATVGA
jgi:hypothetical protein